MVEVVRRGEVSFDCRGGTASNDTKPDSAACWKKGAGGVTDDAAAAYCGEFREIAEVVGGIKMIIALLQQLALAILKRLLHR